MFDLLWVSDVDSSQCSLPEGTSQQLVAGVKGGETWNKIGKVRIPSSAHPSSRLFKPLMPIYNVRHRL